MYYNKHSCCLLLVLQEGVDAVEVVCRPHLLHGFLDLVLLSYGLICRCDALTSEKKDVITMWFRVKVKKAFDHDVVQSTIQLRKNNKN